MVSAGVGLSVAVSPGVGLSVAVSSGLALGVAVGVLVGVAAGVGVLVRVGRVVLVAELIGVQDGVGVADGTTTLVGLAVDVTVAVRVAVDEGGTKVVGLGVGVCVAEGVAVADGAPGVRVGVALAGVRLKGSWYSDDPGSCGLSRRRGRSNQKYLMSASRPATMARRRPAARMLRFKRMLPPRKPNYSAWLPGLPSTAKKRGGLSAASCYIPCS